MKMLYTSDSHYETCEVFIQRVIIRESLIPNAIPNDIPNDILYVIPNVNAS